MLDHRRYSAAVVGDPPAGWFDDPEGPGLRYWDGSRWSEHRHPEPLAAKHAATPLDRFNALPAADQIALALALAAIAGMVIGTFGPWAHALFASKSGIESDGAPVLPCAVIAAAALWLYVGRPMAWRAALSATLGLAGAAIAIVGLVRVADQKIAIIGVHVADPAWGIYLTVASSAVLALGAGYLAILGAREPAE